MKIKTKRGARRTRNQRVITRRFVTTRYECNDGWIYDDSGNVLYIITPDSSADCCAHLHAIGRWEWGVI